MERTLSSQEPIAIVGMGCRFPDAPDPGTFWDNIVQGKSSFKPIPKGRWNHDSFHSNLARELDKTYVTHGAFVDEVDEFAALHFGIAPKRVVSMDPQHRLVLETVRLALEDAGLSRGDFDRSMMGTFLGLSSSEYRNVLGGRCAAQQMLSGAWGETPDANSRAALSRCVQNLEPITAFSIAGTLLNMSAANVAEYWDLGGPAFTVDAACASSLVAIYDAVLYLRAGKCDSAIAGGAYLNLTPENLIGFSRVGAISKTQDCRPFDENAGGFLQGEGVGIIVLKRLGDAMDAGDRIHALIRGAGINSDGHSNGPMAPSLKGQAEAIRRAYSDAGLSPNQVGFVECHGTATKVGDPIEVAALKHVYDTLGQPRDGKTPIYLSSVKANIGHTMSAAGVAGLLKATLVLKEGTIPPQANFERPQAQLDLGDGLFAFSKQAQPWPETDEPRRAAVSSFGFGGTNCHIILEQAPEILRDLPTGEEVVVLSAHNTSLLGQYALDLAEAVKVLPEAVALGDIAYSLNAKRQHEDHRLSLVVRDREELIEKLVECAQALFTEDVAEAEKIENVYLGLDVRAETASPLVFMFPGQGAQKVGLLHDFYERYAPFRESLERYEQALSGVLDRPLLDYLYPSEEGMDLDCAEDALRATEVCQPVMTAIGLAIFHLLQETGVKAGLCVGHSLGEFTAFAAGGLMQDEQMLGFVAGRGRLMAQLPLDDQGAMAAVRGGVENCAPGLSESVQIANINSSRQTVISGTSEGVEEAIVALKDAGVAASRLRVSHAFHSRLMGGLAPAMMDELSRYQFTDLKTSVVSAITTDLYDADDSASVHGAARQIFAEHATRPVDFVGALRTVVEHLEKPFFIEMGAGRTLSKFVKDTLEPGDYEGIASVGKMRGESGHTFNTLIAKLYSMGHLDNFAPLYVGTDFRVVSLPSAPLERQAYWPIREKHTPLGGVEMTQEKPVQSDVDSPKNETQESLVQLFRDQMRLLQKQTDIIAQQTAVLGGHWSPGSVDLSLATEPMRQQTGLGESIAPSDLTTQRLNSGETTESPVAAMPVLEPGPNLNIAEELAAATGDTPAFLESTDALDISSLVLDAVAKVSAFSKSSLKTEHSLAKKLGFDSLMFVELANDLQAKFPKLDGLPQSLLSQETTVHDLISYVEERMNEPLSDIASVVVNKALEGYRVELTRQMRSSLMRDISWSAGWILLTHSDDGLGRALEKSLLEQGARVVSVAIRSGDVLVVEREGPYLLRVNWDGDVEGVSELWAELADLGVCPDALLHAADWRLSHPVQDLIAMDGLAWPNPVHLLHALCTRVGRPGEGHFSAVVTGMGGGFGLEGGEPDGVWQAGLLGYVKSLAREWVGSNVKVLDLDPDADLKVNAAWVIDELQAGECGPEVGFGSEGRVVCHLVPVASSQNELKSALDSDDVIVVVGGHRGIGFKAALELAASQCGLILVGRTPISELGSQLDENMHLLEARGARVAYVQWDVTLRDTSEEPWAAAREKLGPITGVIHAAGVLRDARVENLSHAEIDHVMDVKVGGFLNVLRALRSETLKFVLSFSSWAGRFGNVGQSAYAAANELLNRLATSHDTNGDERWTSVLWPPWEDSPMARTIPAALKSSMRNEGITFVGDDEGRRVVLDLCNGQAHGELLYGVGLNSSQQRLYSHLKISLEEYPFVDQHRINSEALLPLASAVDYLGTAAMAVGKGDYPLSLSQIEVFERVKVEQPVALELVADGPKFSHGPSGTAQLRFDDGKGIAFCARIPDEKKAFEAVPQLDWKVGATDLGAAMSLATFYHDVAFHGPLLQGVDEIVELGTEHVEGWVKTSVPSDWITHSRRKQWTVDPMVIDGCFQLVLYWLWQQHRVQALPVSIGGLVMLRGFDEGRILARVVQTQESGQDDFVGAIRFLDEEGELLAILWDVRAKLIHSADTPRTDTVNHDSRYHLENSGNFPQEGLDHGDQSSEELLEIDECHYKIEAFEEVENLMQRLQAATMIGLRNPYFAVNEGVARNVSVVDGQEMTNFSSYNYLGLSGNAKVTEAAKAAIDLYGTSVSASRVASGEKPLHGELEELIADFLDTEAALVFSAGHATNETVIGHLMGEKDLIIHDSLAHNSILTGAILSGAKRRPFPHNDYQALDEILGEIRGEYEKVLIAIEGVYSMDGDIPYLPGFIEIRDKHKCLLFVDEAHSVGVIGASGRGIAEHFNVDRMGVDIWMGTLSKAFASCGGYIAGSEALVEYLKYTAPGFVFSAGISPANTAAAIAAIREIVEHPELVQRLQSHSRLFLELARENGVDVGLSHDSAIIPCIVGNSLEALRLSERLADRGVNVQPIVYPAVDDSASRLRFFLSCTHTEDQIADTITVLVEELRLLKEPDAASRSGLNAEY
jgi:8-amino-7-oxononanoate synthase